MSTWKVVGVQMDCRLGELGHNLEAVRAGLRRAVEAGAELVVFPECILSGYAFDSRAEAEPAAQPVPGPATEALAADCRACGAFAVVGLLERGPGGELFNCCALVGPAGLVANYRKVHLPYLGVDRFTTPGDRPFAVHDLGGLRLGMNICYDASFPEAARVLMLLGADLIVLPTNWPPGARTTPELLVPARAMENHLYYAAVNRVGEERGWRFIGQSRLAAPDGSLLARAGEGPELLLAEIDPSVARAKRLVKVPGKYELDRLADRRPELYAPLCQKKS
jgi:predicted amidohydrolase